MDSRLHGFTDYLLKEGKSKNTIQSYLLNVREYLTWFQDTFDTSFKKLHRENILDYKAYLLNVRKFKGKNLNAKSVNSKLSSLVCFNKFLIESQIQRGIVIDKRDFVKVQLEYANPCSITKKDVEQFRQKILEDNDRRLYALVTILAYAGLRISEALNIKMGDFNLETKELIVRKGKGEKQRIVYWNTKITNAVKEYLKFRKGEGEYLFTSRKSEKINRTVINKHFKKYSTIITPHMLRHFYASHCLEMGYSVHEVANQAGHRDIKTTLLYTNPSREEMRRKAELL